MIRHILKTWSPYFQDVVDGKKLFEYRKDDRNFAEGDKLHLREFNPVTEEFTGEKIIVDVVYKIRGGAFGIPDEYCILGIRKTEPEFFPCVKFNKNQRCHCISGGVYCGFNPCKIQPETNKQLS